MKKCDDEDREMGTGNYTEDDEDDGYDARSLGDDRDAKERDDLVEAGRKLRARMEANIKKRRVR